MERPPVRGSRKVGGRRGGGPARQPGFTLFELLVTMALMMLVFVLVWQSFAAQRDTYRAQEQMSDIQQNLRVGLDAMSRDLRMAGLRGPTGIGPIVQAAPFQLLLFADANGSCLCGVDPSIVGRSFKVQLAEDVCWGGTTSFGPTVSTTYHWPTDPCPLCAYNGAGCPDGALPGVWKGTDMPWGLTWYGTSILYFDGSATPAALANNSHAELIGWTMDRPVSATQPGNAYPLPAIDAADEALVSLASGCGTSAILPAEDKDPDLSDTGHNLFNIYRWTVRNPGTGNTPAVSARTAAGLAGPCDTVRPQDDAGRPWPLFTYWIDTSNGTGRAQDGKITNNCDGSLNSTTEDVLWGDTNGDCLLSASEYDALTAVSCTSTIATTMGLTPCDTKDLLSNIVRVDIHMRGESAQRNSDVSGANYRYRYLDGSVWVRRERG